MPRIRLFCAGTSRFKVWEGEQGFCVKAVRKPVDSFFLQSVLKTLPDNRSPGKNIRTKAFWSSSQNADNNNNAWNQNFDNGNQNNNNKNNNNNVRAIRAFTQKQSVESNTLSALTVLKCSILEQSFFTN